MKKRWLKVAINVTSMMSPTKASRAASTVSGSSSEILFPGKKPRPWKLVMLNTKAPSGERGSNSASEKVVSNGKPKDDKKVGQKTSTWFVPIASDEKRNQEKSQVPSACMRSPSFIGY